MESVLIHKINIAPSAYFRPSAPSPCSAQPPYLSPLAAQRRYAEATAWYERALALEPRRWILPRPLAQPSVAHLTSEGLPRWRNPIPSAPVRLPSALSLAAAQGPGDQTPPPWQRRNARGAGLHGAAGWAAFGGGGALPSGASEIA